jgi:hypothetical protein
VQSIEQVNAGIDCWHHTVRIGVVGEPADCLCFHRLAAATGFGLKNMIPSQMRNAAADTVNWFLNSPPQGCGSAKELLRNHVDVEARDHLGPRGSNRVQEDATLQQGSLPKGTLIFTEYSMCNVALDGHPERVS